MRFASQRGFLFTCKKGINIKNGWKKIPHRSLSLFLSLSLSPSPHSAHVFSTHHCFAPITRTQWFQHLADQSSHCLLKMDLPFFSFFKPGYRGSERFPSQPSFLSVGVHGLRAWPGCCQLMLGYKHIRQSPTEMYDEKGKTDKNWNQILSSSSPLWAFLSVLKMSPC